LISWYELLSASPAVGCDSLISRKQPGPVRPYGSPAPACGHADVPPTGRVGWQRRPGPIIRPAGALIALRNAIDAVTQRLGCGRTSAKVAGRSTARMSACRASTFDDSKGVTAVRLIITAAHPPTTRPKPAAITAYHQLESVR
jgi:hypothetical protein